VTIQAGTPAGRKGFAKVFAAGGMQIGTTSLSQPNQAEEGRKKSQKAQKMAVIFTISAPSCGQFLIPTKQV
jgi:hypothetical protein